MRKILLALVFIGLGLLSNAQSFYKDVDGKWWINDQEVSSGEVFTRSFNNPDTPTAITLEGQNGFHFINTDVTTIKDKDGNFYIDFTAFELATGEFISENKTELKDRTSPLIIIPMAKEIAATTLSLEGVLNEKTIEVVSITSFVIGQHLRIVDDVSDRFYQGTVIAINTNTITLDNPLDFNYLIGAQVIVATTEMSVNGSVTPIIFKHRLGTHSTPSITNISRMIVTCITDTPVTLSLFGDLTALTNGVLFRKTGDEQVNIFNVKTNRDFKLLAYDFDVSLATNPAQGEDGFTTRLTFTKIGAAIDVKQFENVESIVQDNLLGIISLKIMLGGYRVE